MALLKNGATFFSIAVVILLVCVAWMGEKVQRVEEIEITTQKRATPSLLQIRLKYCNEYYTRNSYNHSRCVNEALGIE